MSQEQRFTFSTTVNIQDTNEVLLEKFKTINTEFERFFLETFNEESNGVNSAIVDQYRNYLDSQMIQNISTFYLKKNSIFHKHNFSGPGAEKMDIDEIIQYLESDDEETYSVASKFILDDVGQSPFSFTIATGAGTYQPQILLPDTEYLNKIHNQYAHNYILAIDNFEQVFGDTNLKESFSKNSTEFIEKTKRWMKKLLGNQEIAFQRINQNLFCLEIKTTENKITKIIYMNGSFFNFNFGDLQTVYTRSSYNIFYCCINTSYPCPDILLSKSIYDNFKIVISSMGFMWQNESKDIAFKNSATGWIFYVEAFKNSGGTYEQLVKIIQHDIQTGRKREKIKELAPDFFFNKGDPLVWSLLGGRRRRSKSTRRRKQKSKRTRKH